MDCRIEDHWPTDSFRIWIWERRGSTLSVLRPSAKPLRGQGWDWHVQDPATEAEPSLTLPRDALEALLRAAPEHVPPSDALNGHLKDTLAIRDRLLTLVESEWQSRQITASPL